MSGLDNPAEIHDGNAITEILYHSDIVSDNDV
jgi:hypothetical protein